MLKKRYSTPEQELRQILVPFNIGALAGIAHFLLSIGAMRTHSSINSWLVATLSYLAGYAYQKTQGKGSLWFSGLYGGTFALIILVLNTAVTDTEKLFSAQTIFLGGIVSLHQTITHFFGQLTHILYAWSTQHKPMVERPQRKD